GDNEGVPCGGLPVASCVVAAHVNIDSFGTVRGRLGYTFGDNRWLAYVTGGFAWQRGFGGIAVTTVVGGGGGVCGACTQGRVARSAGTANGGYAVGGGVEWALWANWTGGVEYRYLSTGDFDNGGFVVTAGSLLARGGVPVGSTISETRSINNNILRARINYRF